MRIDVTALEVGEVLHRHFDERIASESDELAFDEPVAGEIKVVRTGRMVHLGGNVATTTPMVCGRCLESYRQRLAVVLNEAFVFDSPGGPGSDGQLDPGDFAFSLGSARILDVSEVIRQHLLLAAPMVPLCAPTCRGLCPQCGANWNQRTCTCERDTIDPRLAPLQQFVKRPQQDS